MALPRAPEQSVTLRCVMLPAAEGAASAKWHVSRRQNEAAPNLNSIIYPGVRRTVRAHFEYFP
jgi:hypothetical protein